jgi:hypothetical protein
MSFDHIFYVITGLCEISIWWMIWQDYRKDRGKVDLRMPGTKWLLMIVLSLLPIAAVIYHNYGGTNERTGLQEFDVPRNNAVMLSYGLEPQGGCFMNVNGGALASRRTGYKIAIGCFVYDGKTDILDAPYLQVSNLYDIRDEQVYVGAQFADYFKTYAANMHANGINIALLNIPNGVQTSQFTTLRQARALGVLIPDLGTARFEITEIKPAP